MNSTGLLQKFPSRVVAVRAGSNNNRVTASQFDLNKSGAQPSRWGEIDFEPYQASI